MKNNFNCNGDFPNFSEFISSFKNPSDMDSTSSSGFYESANSSRVNDTNSENTNPFGNIDMATILKIKQIMESMNNSKNNPRANLLYSLKPYLRPSRKDKIDQYIKLFSMSELFENLKSNGGDFSK